MRGYDNGDYSDKYLRNPVIWGPSYATGFAVSGSLGRFDYAVEMKNAALSSRPESWDLTERGFEDPTFSGRVGVRPNEMWNLGFSASAGPYLLEDAERPARRTRHWRLPPIRPRPGYQLRLASLSTLGRSLRVALRSAANIGDADTLSYYIEAKYKITPQLFAALRWNQQFFGEIPDEDHFAKWGNDISRIDAVLGYRFTNYLQLKVQYSFSYEGEALHQEGHLAAAQLTVKF